MENKSGLESGTEILIPDRIEFSLCHLFRYILININYERVMFRPGGFSVCDWSNQKVNQATPLYCNLSTVTA